MNLPHTPTRTDKFGGGCCSNQNRVLSFLAVGGLLFAIIIQSPAHAQTLTWTNSAPSPTTGPEPQSIAVGDFDGDGISDIAAGTTGTPATSGIGYISILLGKGDGTFKTANNFTALGTNQAIAASLFVNGGHEDIITVSNAISNVNNAALMFGDGKGGAVSVNPFSLPFGSVTTVATGDLNGDGKQDFVVSGQLGVAIFFGNGNGTFNAPTLIPTSNPASFVSLGDFTGHGRLDLAVATSGNNTVSVLFNDGSGNFSLGASLTVGNDPLGIAVGDFNGDGIQDLAVVNHNDNTVSILLGKGSGSFKPPTTVAVGNGPSRVVVGDFNKDGKADLAVTNTTDNTVTVSLGNGDGTFGAPTAVAVGHAPTGLSIGNFDGHGNVDLAVANSGDNTVSVLLSQLGAASPSITTQPVSQTVIGGVSCTFTAAASGVPPPALQWQKDNVNISGATSSSYTIASVAAGDAGSYTVVATNSAGSATSNPAVLTIVFAPSNAIISITVQ